MNDEKIVSLAKEFGIPVFSKRVYENELNKYEYIVIRKGKLYKKDCKFYRKISINYIHEDNQEISDSEIIKKFDRPGFKFDEMDIDEFKIADKDQWIDINSYYFIRVENYD